MGPEQPNQSSGSAMTMQNGWTKRKGRVEGGMKTSFRTYSFSTVTFVDSEREKMAFFWANREKSHREYAWCNTKLAHLSSSLSFGDWSSADVSSNFQCSVWEVAEGDVCSVQKGMVITAKTLSLLILLVSCISALFLLVYCISLYIGLPIRLNKQFEDINLGFYE